MDPLIVVVGQTASGKSSLALALAERYNGEIIAADSRTIYKGMDVGTAKPSTAEQERIPHHLLDVVTPDQAFTVADFKLQAQVAIKDTQSRGKLPILVGGTGLYIDSVLYDFTLRPVDQAQRAELEGLSVPELQERIIGQGFELPNNPQNPRHLVRVLESNGAPSVRKPLRSHTLVIGLDVPVEVLQQRITERVAHMFQNGLESEVQGLSQKYAWQTPGMSAIGYAEFEPYIAKQYSLKEVTEQIIVHTRQYAKRQKTWFKRNPDIRWCTGLTQAEHLAEAFLTTKDAA